MCPGIKELSQSALLRTNLTGSSTEFPLNFSQCDNQWFPLHSGHVTFHFVGTGSLLALGGSVWLPDVPACLAKVEPSCSFFGVLRLLLRPAPATLFFTSFEWMFPNTGWLAILAFASTNCEISTMVTSLFCSSVITSAWCRHFCRSSNGSRPMILGIQSL